MPRQSRGPYLDLTKARPGHPSVWRIRDRINGERKDTSTRLGAGASEQERADALADYLRGRHDPAPRRGRNPDQAIVADCIAIYLDARLVVLTPLLPTDRRAISRQKEAQAQAKRLIKFFGECTVDQVTGNLQKEYAKQRGSQSSARRELSMLAAAINAYTKDAGGLHLKFSPTLPDDCDPRDRWLTRQEAAKLVMSAWRARQTDRGGWDGRRVGQHVARAILVGLYTGTRAGAVCGAALTQSIGRGFVDLDRGVFIRKARGSRDTNKKQPTVKIPPKLLAHMRRWKRLGISNHSVIEWCGKPVKSVYRGFTSARVAAGLDAEVIPHTLRHTAISWYLRAGEPKDTVSEYCGVSIHVLNKHYRHHMPGAFDGIMDASRTFGRTDISRKAAR